MKDSLLAFTRYQNPRHVMFWYGFEPVVNYSVKPLTSVGGYSAPKGWSYIGFLIRMYWVELQEWATLRFGYIIHHFTQICGG